MRTIVMRSIRRVKTTCRRIVAIAVEGIMRSAVVRVFVTMLVCCMNTDWFLGRVRAVMGAASEDAVRQHM
jgi:hypothetical protein